MPQHCLGRMLLLLLLLVSVTAAASVQTQPLVVEHGTYSVHLLLHIIGSEEYTLTRSSRDALILNTTTTTSDRGTGRTSTAMLSIGALFAPARLLQRSTSGAAKTESFAETKNELALLREGAATRTTKLPSVAYLGFGSMPAAMQMMMIRYR